MTHSELVAAIIKRCDDYGLLVHYCRHSVSCAGPGLPDLLIVGHYGVLFAEIKTPRDIVRPEQRRWAKRLHLAGAPVTVWRPLDYEHGLVELALIHLATGK